MKEITESEDNYEKANNEREKYVEAVLNSLSNNKIVVGGPGTGKTYLFKKVLEGKRKALTLTFINHLVEDLSLELCGLSEVRTLHSFAYNLLSSHSKGVKIFPDLWKVIQEDARILLNKEVDFDKLFHNRLDKNEHIEFYKKRREYYKHYGYSDVIFGAVLYLEKFKNKIPDYDQVVVDEFQDFNTLEVSLIDLLSEKSPVLLVGDDDQALYDFKSASTKHIRERHSENNVAYASFSLPHCSRCTRVIVETANDVIKKAIENGLLINRIKKHYHYFEDKVKDKESAQYNKVVYCQRFATEIPLFIEQQIGNIAKDIKDTFSVLIISPLRKKSAPIVKALKKKGLDNIEFVEKKDPKEKPTLMDGLKILLGDEASNLGWRIVSECCLDNNDFNSLIKETEDRTKDIFEIVDDNFKIEVVGMIKLLRAIENNKKVEEIEFDNFLRIIKYDLYNIAKKFLKDEITSISRRLYNPGLRKISIKSRTIRESKGLSADYVFITHFDDHYFIKKTKDKKEVSDQHICNFLVALTRAKRKVFLISSIEEEPTFLKWINAERIDKLPPPLSRQKGRQGS